MTHVPEDWGYCDQCEGQREHERHKRTVEIESKLDALYTTIREVGSVESADEMWSAFEKLEKLLPPLSTGDTSE